MAQARGLSEQDLIAQQVPKRSNSNGGLTLAKMLLKNPAALRKLRVMGPDEPRYVRPLREYELPEYREGMKQCTSNEKYLRSTRYCNPRESLVVAMANELGAYELSDWEFADAAYWFIKTKLVAEFLPLDSVSATLKRGTGTCYHLTSAFVALCRAAGIKARYKSFMMLLPEAITSRQMPESSAMTVDFFKRPTPEVEGEAHIDGKWVVGYVAMRPEMLALGNLPITRFGEDAMDFTFKVIPGTTERFESIPLRRAIQIKAGMWLMPAAMERAGAVVQTRALPLGRKAIEEAGGIEAYDWQARERLKQPAPTVEIEDNEALVFEPE